MKKKSAGILLYRIRKGKPEVMLVHPGGPFWKNKNTGTWSIPKGEFADNEDRLEAARREFREETGIKVEGEFVELDPIVQKNGKQVYAWAVRGDPDISDISSNTFEMEWPPRSGKKQQFPEVDKAGWFSLEEARGLMTAGQAALLDQLEKLVEKDLEQE